MIMACFSYGMIIINEPHIVLPWNRADCTPNPSQGEWCATRLYPSFGWSWYLVLFTGIAVFIGGVVLYFIDFFVPRWTAPWFHHNIIEEDEEFLTVQNEKKKVNSSRIFFRRKLNQLKRREVTLLAIVGVVVARLAVGVVSLSKATKLM